MVDTAEWPGLRSLIRVRTERNGPAVMGILRRAALNLVCTLQQNFRPFLSIGLLRDKIGRNPALLVPILV